MSKYFANKVYVVDINGVKCDFTSRSAAEEFCAERGVDKDDVMVFDSRKEYKRWDYLLAQEHVSAIYNLRRQVPFTLIPAQYKEELVIGKRSSKLKRRRIEAPVIYKADFVYNLPDGSTVVEDVKSPHTRKLSEYIIKRKLMLHVHGIRLTEII